jgi:hypothetical protein
MAIPLDLAGEVKALGAGPARLLHGQARLVQAMR